MPDLELKHLRLVAVLADTLTLTKAADRLQVTQSALSHQLRAVEERVGTPLFQRLGRRMQVTAAGQRLLSAARRVLPEIDLVERTLRNGGTDQRQPIRVAVEPYVGFAWLPRVAAEYARTQPNREIAVHTVTPDRMMDAIRDGEVDVGLVFSPVRVRALASRFLFEDEQVVLVSRQHRLSERPWVAPSALGDERLLVYTPAEQFAGERRGLRLATTLRLQVQTVEVTGAMLELVAAGAGVAMVPRWGAQAWLDSGRVSSVRLGRTGTRRWWRALVGRHSAAVPHIGEFVQLLGTMGGVKRIPGV